MRILAILRNGPALRAARILPTAFLEMLRDTEAAQQLRMAHRFRIARDERRHHLPASSTRAAASPRLPMASTMTNCSTNTSKRFLKRNAAQGEYDRRDLKPDETGRVRFALFTGGPIGG